ncbi:MAG TPA: hypothetical protein VIH28_09315 [Ignavibacteriaceae bacterium]
MTTKTYATDPKSWGEYESMKNEKYFSHSHPDLAFRQTGSSGCTRLAYSAKRNWFKPLTF